MMLQLVYAQQLEQVGFKLLQSWKAIASNCVGADVQTVADPELSTTCKYKLRSQFKQ